MLWLIMLLCFLVMSTFIHFIQKPFFNTTVRAYINCNYVTNSSTRAVSKFLLHWLPTEMEHRLKKKKVESKLTLSGKLSFHITLSGHNQKDFFQRILRGCQIIAFGEKLLPWLSALIWITLWLPHSLRKSPQSRKLMEHLTPDQAFYHFVENNVHFHTNTFTSYL